MTRSSPSALALPATAIVAALWIAVACAVGGSSGPPTHTTQVSVAPTRSGTTVIATTAAQSVAEQSTNGATSDPSAPPAGWLSGGGDPVSGFTGSYCWFVAGASMCADLPPFTDSAPDLPVLTLAVSASQLHFSLAGNYAFASWSASYVDDNGNVVSLGSEGASFDPDAAHPSVTSLTKADFSAPPAHDESIVQVFVRFADGGDSSYGWNVAVP